MSERATILCVYCGMVYADTHGPVQDEPPTPPQPGDTVLVEAVVEQVHQYDGEPELSVFLYVKDINGEEQEVWVHASAIHPAPAKPVAIKCDWCKDTGKVPDDDGGPNIWMVPCPKCQPAKKGEAS